MGARPNGRIHHVRGARPSCQARQVRRGHRRLMRIVRHPLVDQNLTALVDHIVEVTGGGFDAAGRRLDEIDELIRHLCQPAVRGSIDATARPMAGPPWRTRPSPYRRVPRGSHPRRPLCRTCCLRWSGLDDGRRDSEILWQLTDIPRDGEGGCDTSILQRQVDLTLPPTFIQRERESGFEYRVASYPSTLSAEAVASLLVRAKERRGYGIAA